MSGILTHLFVAVLSALIIHLIHFKWEYSTAIFLGNLIPDIPKFALTAVKQGSLNIFGVNQDSFYWNIASLTSNTANWFALGFFVALASTYLFHHHVIKKKTMEEYDLLYVFLVAGILTHLIMDVFFIETSAWF